MQKTSTKKFVNYGSVKEQFLISKNTLKFEVINLTLFLLLN